MKLKIDTIGVSFICTRTPEQRLAFDTGQPRIDRETGQPLWQVQLMALDGSGAEVIAVTVAGDPRVTVAQPVQVDGLVALPWNQDGRSGVAYRADTIRASGSPLTGVIAPPNSTPSSNSAGWFRQERRIGQPGLGTAPSRNCGHRWCSPLRSKRYLMPYSSKTRNNNASGSLQSDWDETITLLFVGLGKGLGILIWWAVLFPMVSVPALVSLWAGLQISPILGLLIASASGVGFAAWAYLSPASFNEWIAARARSRWRTWWIYRRRWEAVCALHGLTASMTARTLVPALRSVTIGTTCDVAVVQILVGQSVADWQRKGLALAEALRAQRVTIRSRTPGEIAITVHRRDALVEPIRLQRRSRDSAVEFSRVRVGITESGKCWHLPVLGHHILVGGATGAGKGSVLWSLIAGLAPGVHSGTVRVLVIDPKGGMEFGRGQQLFSGFAYDNGERTLALLRVATAVMQQRANRLRGHTRLHSPTISAPLIVVVVDEIASLTAYIGDRKVRCEVEQLLGLLLSQGRAVGISVIAAVQDPSKDVLPVRQLFSVRIGMRMTESTQTTMVLGAAARDAGALCDEILTTTPGVAYVCQDGRAEPIRVRAFHVTDPDIDYLATQFPPLPRKAAP